MNGMEPLSADDVKRRKRRNQNDLGSYERSSMAEEFVKEWYRLLIRSIFEFDLDSYEYGIEMLGFAIGGYEQANNSIEVDGLKSLTKGLSSVFKSSVERDRIEQKAYEQLKQFFGTPHIRQKQRDKALVIGFNSEDVKRFTQFYSLYPLEVLNYARFEPALEVIDDTHEHIAVIVIDSSSFADKGEAFYRDLNNQERLRDVRIVKYNAK